MSVPSRRRGTFAPAPAFALALALAAAPEARAARPMVTDDARIVDARSCQLETWLRGFRDGGTEYWALPGCNPFGAFELTLGGATLPATGGLVRDRALQAQVKTLLRSLSTNSWGVGLAAGTLDLFPGDRGRRTDDPYAYVPLSVSTWDDRVVWHLNVGATWASDGGRSVRATWGVGLEGVVRPRVLVVAETYGVQDARPLWQLGLRLWLLPERVQLDATVGDQFGPAGLGRWFTLGLRLLSPPFLP